MSLQSESGECDVVVRRGLDLPSPRSVYDDPTLRRRPKPSSCAPLVTSANETRMTECIGLTDTELLRGPRENLLDDHHVTGVRGHRAECRCRRRVSGSGRHLTTVTRNGRAVVSKLVPSEVRPRGALPA